MVCSLALFAPVVAAGGSSSSGVEAHISALEHRVEAAYLDGDTAFLDASIRDDFRFTHANGKVEGKAETLAQFAKPGNFASRALTAVDVEIHDNAALTSGRIEVASPRSGEYTICYVRLYLRGEGTDWQLVSHRSYRGAPGHDEACAAR